MNLSNKTKTVGGKVAHFIQSINVLNSNHEEESEEEKTLKEIWQAHEEWKTALINFDYITGNELVDYSIYHIETAQKKFVYLLKQAQRSNIQVPGLAHLPD